MLRKTINEIPFYLSNMCIYKMYSTIDSKQLLFLFFFFCSALFSFCYTVSEVSKNVQPTHHKCFNNNNQQHSLMDLLYYHKFYLSFLIHNEAKMNDREKKEHRKTKANAKTNEHNSNNNK